MKKQITVDLQVAMKAILRNDELKLVLSVGVSYGDTNPRVATHIVEDFPEEISDQVRIALQTAIDSCIDEAARDAQRGAAIAEKRARELGEVL